MINRLGNPLGHSSHHVVRATNGPPHILPCTLKVRLLGAWACTRVFPAEHRSFWNYNRSSADCATFLHAPPLLTPSCGPSQDRAYRDMVERHGFDDTEGTGNVCWVQADLRVPSEAIAGAQKVGVIPGSWWTYQCTFSTRTMMASFHL